MTTRPIKFKKLVLILGLSALGTLAAGPASAAPAQYHVQCQDCDLPPAANTYNLVYAINRHGVIAGQAQDTAAVLYDHGARTTLGTLGGPSSIAWDVNDSMVAVGEAVLPDGSTRAFAWKDGVMTNLGVLYAGDAYSIANGINRTGQVVGTSTTPGGNLGPTITHCFLASHVRTQAPMADLGLPPGAPVNGQCAQPSINRNGHVALTVGDETWNGRDGYLLRDGHWTRLGTLDTDFPNSFAEGMNDLDEVVGWSSSKAFLWKNGVMQDLGYLSGDGSGGAGAYGINVKSHVVGVSSIAGVVKDQVPYSTAAFLYKDRKMTDLNAMLDASSRKWYLERAIDIDDNEAIAAIGYLQGVAHAVLLVPMRCGHSIELLDWC